MACTQIGDRFIDGSEEVPSIEVGRIWEAIEGRGDTPPTFGRQEPARGSGASQPNLLPPIHAGWP
jgi:hypothetical protein